MSYNNSGYGSARPNPYDQRGSAPRPPPQGGYSSRQQSPGYSQQSPGYNNRQQYNNGLAMGRDDYAGQNVEMASLTQNGSQFASQPPQGSDPFVQKYNVIDDDIKTINKEVSILGKLQMSALGSVNNDMSRVDTQAQNVMDLFREITPKMRELKSMPQARGALSKKVGVLEGLLVQSKNRWQTQDRDYQAKLKDQIARQYRVVNPAASEEEVRRVVEDSDPAQNVFAQAVMQSNRRGQAQSTMSAVKSRHEEIQKIERQMIELAQLFEQMNELVVQQEEAVANIEMKGEEVVENMDKGTQQIGVAIKSAKNARKWKWWCLGICVLIVAIIVIVVLIYKFVIQNNNTTKSKRFVLPGVEHRVISTFSTPTIKERSPVPGLDIIDERWVVSGEDWTPESKPVVIGEDYKPTESKLVLADVPWTGENKPIVAGEDFKGTGRKFRRFQA